MEIMVDWASGLVIGLLVFGFILFLSSVIAAVVCCFRQKKKPIGYNCFNRFSNCRKQDKDSKSDSSDTDIFRKKDNSEQSSNNSNSTEISSISLTSAVVTSLQSQFEYKNKSIYTNKYSTLILKSNITSNNKNTPATDHSVPDASSIERRPKTQNDSNSTTQYLQPFDGPKGNVAMTPDQLISDSQTESRNASEVGTVGKKMPGLIRSKRGSFMPPAIDSRTMSVLTEEKWDSAIDLAFENFA